MAPLTPGLKSSTGTPSTGEGPDCPSQACRGLEIPLLALIIFPRCTLETQGYWRGWAQSILALYPYYP